MPTLEAWLRRAAAAAERRDEAISFELGDLLELAASGVESSDSWALSFRSWLDASAKDKLKALSGVVRPALHGSGRPFLGRPR